MIGEGRWLCIVGGRQKNPREIVGKREWHHHQCGVIVGIDLGTGKTEVLTTYVSPPEFCPDEDPSITFKAASVLGSRLYVCTTTEILVYRVRDWVIEHRISLPRFNDLHHVCAYRPDPVVVVNTGLDAVVEVSLDGTVTREWGVMGGDPWDEFSKDTDYRKIHSLKPRLAHPNFTFRYDGDLWCVRLMQADAISLTGNRPPMNVRDLQGIHDGIVFEDSIHFTTVDGTIIRVDGRSGRPNRAFDLNAMVKGNTPLGWCRGLARMGESQFAVGFSRLRKTKWTQNIRWVKHKFGGDGSGLNPSRIRVFDLETNQVLAEYDLEPVGLNDVFSIHLMDGENDGSGAEVG